ncbi:MAG: NAD(P)/FAD-dependent oxidoreductase [Candidatus Dormibacteria bacterium]
MRDAPRVVVVGGGIAGLTIAWELGRRGARVTLVRSDRPRTSVVAAGMLAPMPEALVTGSMLRLGVEALRHYPEFLETLAEDTARPTGFVRSGVLRLATGEAAIAALREEVGSYEAAGMPSQWLDARSARTLAPGLPPSIAGGLLSFEEAQVQPVWLLAALEEAAFRREVATVDGRVAKVSARRDGVEVHLDQGGLIAGDRLVLAAGSWTSELAADIPVRPVKGQLLAFAAGEGPEPIIYHDHHYLLTKPDGAVLLGGTMEEAGFSLEPDGAGTALRELLPVFWPSLSTVAAETRVGLRPASPDGLPLCGGLPGMQAVYAFTAHFRNGFLLCPHGARLAAREILDGEAQELFNALRPARFRSAPL